MTDNGGCDENANCKNIRGGFECSCKEGYSGDGFTCDLFISEKQENNQAVGIGVGVTFGLLGLVVLALLILFYLKRKVNFLFFLMSQNEYK